jgi:hypothetical protein
MNPKVGLTVTDKVPDLRKQLAELAKMQVYVGIPQEKNSRKGNEPGNAELLYIHSHGSPLKGIPKRAVIEPAIEATGNKEPIAEELADAARAVLDGNPAKAKQSLRRAGMTGQNAARAWFTDARNGWKQNSKNPLGPFLARKLSEKLGKKITPDMSYYDVKQMYASGEGDPQPLVFYGELRKAIIYILKDDDQ